MRALLASLLISASCSHATPSLPPLGPIQTLWGARSDLEMSYVRRPASKLGKNTVVLLHPWGLDHRVWRHMVEPLGRSHELILVDLPGHGASDKSWTSYTMSRLARAVVDVLNHARVGRVVLIGNSLGGATALEVARLAPERVKGMILLGAPGGGPLPASLLRLQRQTVTARNLASLSDAAWEVGIWVGVRSASAREELSALMADIRRAPDWSAAARSSAEVFDAVVRYQPDLASIRAPALVVHGTQDRVVPAHLSHALAEGLPQSRRIELSNCGHVPEIECPSSLIDVVLAFLTKAEALARARQK